MQKEKYPWMTDLHLNNVSFWRKWMFISKEKKERPKGIFITGDISNGVWLTFDLKLLAKIGCPIYFVLGNHELHWSSREKTYEKVRKVCAKYPHMVWLEDEDVVKLDDEIALIGASGWYDSEYGDTKWLKYTFDWFLIKEPRQLNSMDERVALFRSWADDSTNKIKQRLQKALDMGYKTVYVLTHFPPFIEATRDAGTIMERFWLPYNTNIRLGRAIEEVMGNYKNRTCHILCGHSHDPLYIRVSRSIDCQVGEGKYVGVPNSQKIYL